MSKTETAQLLFSVVVLLFKYNFCLRNKYVFYRSSGYVENFKCLFPYVFCRPESSKTCYFSTVLTLLLLTMVSVSHIYCRHRARFHCVCPSESVGMFNLGQNSETKIGKPAFRHQPVLISLIKYAVSAYQSALCMETLS